MEEIVFNIEFRLCNYDDYAIMNKAVFIQKIIYDDCCIHCN